MSQLDLAIQQRSWKTGFLLWVTGISPLADFPATVANNNRNDSFLHAYCNIVPLWLLKNKEQKPPQWLFFWPAVSLWYFFDGQSDLVTQVSTGVHHSECAFTQNHSLSVLIILIVVLWRQETHANCHKKRNIVIYTVFAIKNQSKIPVPKTWGY